MLLKFSKQKTYFTNAMFYNAINTVHKNTLAYRKNRGGGRTGVWQAIVDVVNDLKQEYGHTLPTHPLSMKRSLKKYNKEGYSSILHKNDGNQNSRKVTAQFERLLLSMFSMTTKPYPNIILDYYNEFIANKREIFDRETGELFYRNDFWNENKGRYKEISIATVWNYINNPKNRAIVDKLRNDWHYYNNEHRPHRHRHAPEFSGSKISLDDRDLPRKYTVGNKSYWLKAYYAYDVTSRALIGVAYSKKKDKNLFVDVIRDMFGFLHRHNVGMPLEMEVEHHIVSQFKDDLMKAGNVFKIVHFCAAGNSQEKRAEHMNKAKKYGFEKRYHDGIGRFHLSEANRPPQSHTWDDEGMHEKNKKHTFEELVADDKFIQDQYNNGLHPNQETYPGKTRLDVFKENLNPELIKHSDAKIARYAGKMTETSIRRNQYVRAFNDKFMLPSPEIIAKLKPNNYKVKAYGLDGIDGIIKEVHIFQDDNYIASCKQLQTYNEAQVERTPEDEAIKLEQDRYVAKYDKMIKNGIVEKISKTAFIENRDYKEPEKVEIHESKPIMEDWNIEHNNKEFEEQEALEDL